MIRSLQGIERAWEDLFPVGTPLCTSSCIHICRQRPAPGFGGSLKLGHAAGLMGNDQTTEEYHHRDPKYISAPFGNIFLLTCLSLQGWHTAASAIKVGGCGKWTHDIPQFRGRRRGSSFPPAGDNGEVIVIDGRNLESLHPKVTVLDNTLPATRWASRLWSPTFTTVRLATARYRYILMARGSHLVRHSPSNPRGTC